MSYPTRGRTRANLYSGLLTDHIAPMTDTATPPAEAAETPKERESEKTLRIKWRTSLDMGWTVIPSALLKGLPRLHIGATDLATLICLIDYWWAPESQPWPSKRALAERLGVSQKTIQRSLKRLQDEKLIVSEARRSASGGQTSNRYDLSPLVRRLEGIVADMKQAALDAEAAKRAATRPSGNRRKGI